MLSWSHIWNQRTLMIFLAPSSLELNNFSLWLEVSYFWSSHSQHLLNLWLEIKWVISWSVVVDDLSFLVDKEFCEVPWDFTGCLLFSIVKRTIHAQKLINRVSIFTVYFNLWEHWELDVISLLCPVFDFSICSWFLALKLITWECKDHKTFIAELLMELYHFFVVLCCQTSLCCNVDHHYAFFTLN